MYVVESHKADANSYGTFYPVHTEALEEGAPAFVRPDVANGRYDARVDVQRVHNSYRKVAMWLTREALVNRSSHSPAVCMRRRTMSRG